MKIEDEDLNVEEEILPQDEQEEETVEQSEVSNESEEPATIQDEDEDEEDRIVTIGDSVPEGEAEETEETKETPGWVKKVRKVNRKLESENRKLKRALEEKEKVAQAEKPVELGPKPTLAASKYDDVKFAEEIIAYDGRKRQIEAQATENAKVVEEQNKSWQTRQEIYVNQKQEHSFKDFSETEELVSNTLSQTQQGILVQGADDAALVVYALGKNPKKLEELAAINNPVNFAFAMSKLESQLKVTSKKAPKPEQRVNATKKGGLSGNTDKVLERLREAAAKTGDYTEVSAYKNKLRKG